VFPFSSRSLLRNGKLVPFAIDEADRLYERHMHIGGALWQMAKTREECILDESGLDNFPNRTDAPFDTGSLASWSNDKHYSVVSSTGGNDEGDKFLDLVLLDQKIAEAESAIKKAQASGDRAERRRAQERKEDLVRLKRVEAIYVRGLNFSCYYTNIHVTECNVACYARLCSRSLEALACIGACDYWTTPSVCVI
jgi:hypothetical protein